MFVIEINGATDKTDNNSNQKNQDELAISEEEGEDALFLRLSNISYEEFFHNYMQKNVPCVLDQSNTASWPSRRDWVMEENGELVPDLTRKEMKQTIFTLIKSHCKLKSQDYLKNPFSLKGLFGR